MLKSERSVKIGMKEERDLDIYFYITGWVCIGIFGLIIAGIKLWGTSILGFMPHCALHAMTGYYCPGCGGTRAVYALMHGKILRSIYYHPFVFYVAVVGIWFMISQTIERLTKGKVSIALHFRQAYIWIAILLIICNFVIKNGVLLLTGIALM